MARHDYRCVDCGYAVKDLQAPVLNPFTNVYALWPVCPKCRIALTREWAAPAFSIKGYNADNGYSK
jgi:predicted nucleic acid-binding Zn ribbon protein